MTEYAPHQAKIAQKKVSPEFPSGELLTLYVQAKWYAEEHYDEKVRQPWKETAAKVKTEILRRMEAGNARPV